MARQGNQYSNNVLRAQGRPARKGETKPMALERLRTYSANSMSIDDLVELSGECRVTVDEYEKVGVEVPDWVTAQLKSLRREIRVKTQDSIESQLAKIDAQMEQTMTAAERRDKLAAKRAELTQKLGATA